MGDLAHLANIKKCYGSQVEMYFKSENILPCKVKCGGLKLKNLSDLMVCYDIRKQEQVIKEFSRLKKLCLNARKFVGQKNTLEKKNDVTSISLRKKIKANDNDYLNKVHVKVIMHDTSAKISAKCPSKRCILDKAISGTQIYKHIMKTKVRPFEIENNSDINSIQQLISILELFKEKHRVHNYKGFLKKIVCKDSLKKYCKISGRGIQKPWENLKNYEITAQQLSTFVTQIIIAVIPIELFGCYKNREIFTKLVCRVLRSARFQPIYLKPYIEKLNIKKMTWLQAFESESVQWLITVKVVKWLLLEYVIKILYKYIHVTVHPSAVGKRLYFQHYLWHRIKKNFIQENINSKILLPIDKTTDTTSIYWHPPICEYKLFMKNSGLRPIIKVKCPTEEISEIKLSLQFLRQLCITHYGLTSMVEFHEKWKTIAHERNISKCNKIWLVSCDLSDAYGSILLDQLIRIIRFLCKDLPEHLSRKWIAYLPYKHKDSEIIYIKYFSDLQVVVPAGTLYTSVPVMNKRCNCYVDKKKLLLFIKTCIFRQKIQVKGEEYLVGKGILQGATLSNILFDIYYSYISHRRLSIFLKSGTLFRYVDDILYLTESMESAIEFIRKIKNGFPKYNCKFKSSKIQTNLSYENNYAQNEITYLGLKINCNTLEALPCYAEVHPSCLFTVALKNRKQNDSITLLKNKLYNHSHLRLSYIILKDPTTFVRTLMTLVKKIATIHAWRALMFIRKLFKDVHRYVKSIFVIIKRSNEKMLKSLLNLYTRDIQENLKIDREQLKIKIFQSLWTALRRVFSTDITFREAFEHLLMQEIRKVKI